MQVHRIALVASAISMTKSRIQDWENYFNDVGIGSALSERYMAYVRSCFQEKIPPIFENEHLALLLGRDNETLTAMTEATDKFYRSFTLQKRSGGSRTISAPYPSLLECQRWIKTNILDGVFLPNCVTGFRHKYSIIDNARMHCGRNELLKIDLKDFFPSIGIRRVLFVFNRLGYPPNVAYALSKLCTLDNQLPQGAATSPTLSNIIARSMDSRIYKICKANRLRYTRYADDIAISGKQIAPGIRRMFFEIIEDEGFTINPDKVRFLAEGDRKIITGLDISSGAPRVTRKYRRELKKDVYYVWSAGLSTHVSRRKIFEPNYLEQLEGRVRFWASVEPNDAQMKKTLDRVTQIKLLSGTQIKKGRPEGRP